MCKLRNNFLFSSWKLSNGFTDYVICEIIYILTKYPKI
jgi:hypothetical protein